MCIDARALLASAVRNTCTILYIYNIKVIYIYIYIKTNIYIYIYIIWESTRVSERDIAAEMFLVRFRWVVDVYVVRRRPFIISVSARLPRTCSPRFQ